MYDALLDLSHLVESIPESLRRAVDLNLEDDIDEDGSFYVASVRTLIEDCANKPEVS
jgi:hypothetical protein